MDVELIRSKLSFFSLTLHVSLHGTAKKLNATTTNNIKQIYGNLIFGSHVINAQYTGNLMLLLFIQSYANLIVIQISLTTNARRMRQKSVVSFEPKCR